MDTWPPEYTVRISKKAKYPQLQFCPYTGLKVVLPNKKLFNIIEPLLYEKRSWIQKQLSNKKSLSAMPRILELKTINQIWHIVFIKNSSTATKLIPQNNQTLLLLNHHNNPRLGIDLINQWLILQAKKYLPGLLQQISLETKLIYQGLSIRQQKSRWGSCSYRKNISLNAFLLFLPKLLTRHVLLHELCHTQHLNHSHRFWALLKQFDPLTDFHDNALKKANQFIPDCLTILT